MTTATLTLADFLLARIAEDEAAARAAAESHGAYQWGDDAATEAVEMADGEGCATVGIDHLRRWLPARVLAECEAKRRIVEAHDLHMHASGTWTCDTGESWWPVGFDLNEETGSGEADRSGGCSTLRLLAESYADHPDYREEWRV